MTKRPIPNHYIHAREFVPRMFLRSYNWWCSKRGAIERSFHFPRAVPGHKNLYVRAEIEAWWEHRKDAALRGMAVYDPPLPQEPVSGGGRTSPPPDPDRLRRLLRATKLPKLGGG